MTGLELGARWGGAKVHELDERTLPTEQFVAEMNTTMHGLFDYTGGSSSGYGGHRCCNHVAGRGGSSKLPMLLGIYPL